MRFSIVSTERYAARGLRCVAIQGGGGTGEIELALERPP